jgi:putative hydrolase of the HAD superfamily
VTVTTIRAVLWDFGGVILESPFEAFSRYEAERGLPTGFLRGLNANNPDTNAWAQMERGEVTMERFGELFEAEAAAAGREIVAREVLMLLSGGVRPAMVEAVRRCRTHCRTALLTNNFVGFTEGEGTRARPELEEIMGLFDVVVESSKVGLRKPDPRFYELALETVAVDAVEAVFLDDLGINLKPARAMGIHTIKVTDPDAALAELEGVVGFPVRVG